MTPQRPFTNSDNSNQNIHQNQTYDIIAALDEADAAAEANDHRLSHEEVFSKLKDLLHP